MLTIITKIRLSHCFNCLLLGCDKYTIHGQKIICNALNMANCQTLLLSVNVIRKRECLAKT
jgi:hypothetical protein